MNNTETIAGALYEHYCASVGGKAFNGDPLPDWVEFGSDPNKTKQADAWRAVAGKAQELLSHGCSAPKE